MAAPGCFLHGQDQDTRGNWINTELVRWPGGWLNGFNSFNTKQSVLKYIQTNNSDQLTTRTSIHEKNENEVRILAFVTKIVFLDSENKHSCFAKLKLVNC